MSDTARYSKKLIWFSEHNGLATHAQPSAFFLRNVDAHIRAQADRIAELEAELAGWKPKHAHGVRKHHTVKSCRCGMAIYDDAAKDGYCVDCGPPEGE